MKMKTNIKYGLQNTLNLINEIEEINIVIFEAVFERLFFFGFVEILRVVLKCSVKQIAYLFI